MRTVREPINVIAFPPRRLYAIPDDPSWVTVVQAAAQQESGTQGFSGLALGTLLIGLATCCCAVLGTLAFILAPIGTVSAVLVGIGAFEERFDLQTVVGVGVGVVLSVYGVLLVLHI